MRELIRGFKAWMDASIFLSLEQMDCKADEWRNERQIFTVMTVSAMINGCFSSVFLTVCTDRLCCNVCFATPGRHAAVTAVHSPIICIWHKVHELHLTLYYCQFNWVTSWMRRTELLVVMQVTENTDVTCAGKEMEAKWPPWVQSGPFLYGSRLLSYNAVIVVLKLIFHNGFNYTFAELYLKCAQASSVKLNLCTFCRNSRSLTDNVK